MNLKQDFERNGWVLIKDFFTESEIETIRMGTERSIKEQLKTDLLCNPYLSELTILNPKIVNVVKQLLDGEIIYIGDSSISNNDLVMSLHKDNPDKLNGKAPDWQSDYNILRMGIYLQDYTQMSGGLILRNRSHLYPTRWKGKVINVQSKPGDLIIWNLRTTHSGNAKRLKVNPSFDLNPYLCKLLPAFLFKETPDTRMALFLSYGIKGTHMDRYIKYLKTRKYAIDRWNSMTIEKSTIERANQIGFQVLDLTTDAKQVDVSALNEKHVELEF